MREAKLFADTYQLCLTLFARTKSMAKALRPNIGGRLEKTCLDLLLSIRIALVSSGPHRMKYLIEASRFLDEVKLLIQLAKDLQAISIAGFGELSSLSLEIGKELGGMIKHDKRSLGNTKAKNIEL